MGMLGDISYRYIVDIIYTPGTHLTSVLIGTDHILGGWWSNIEVIQVLGIYSRRVDETPGPGGSF